MLTNDEKNHTERASLDFQQTLLVPSVQLWPEFSTALPVFEPVHSLLNGIHDKIYAGH